MATDARPFALRDLLPRHVLRGTQGARYFDHGPATVPDWAGAAPLPVTFTVVERVAGPTLERVLAEHKGASMPLERARRIASQIVLALSDVHANNVVHRDLKPSNVLLA